MKYRDIITFTPIETVVQLRQSEGIESARALVRSLVLSDRLADDLLVNVLSQLSLTNASAKGVFVVGNYGTGKSHIMSVVAGIAEHGSLVHELTTRTLDEKLEGVAGNFVTIRAEINGNMPLRDFVMGELKDHLGSVGVDFAVPSADLVRNHKDVFEDMMAQFDAVHPGKGVLFVLDELLDYLRANDAQRLADNLNFLRAAGEFCSGSRFRFIAGVQESLFANSAFQFQADGVQRVQARFVQMRIVRDDVSHVVAERLLRKTPAQMGLVRSHLLKFAPLYEHMADRMDSFVRLYPVHPAYFDVFEQIHVAEKREVLKTISQAIGRLLEGDEDIPVASTGLLAYDSYWSQLSGTPAFLANPDIREVVSKSKTLENRITASLNRPAYQAVAIRIIHALSVQRLAQSDIHAPIGVTSAELRDGLCLQLGLPPGNETAEFLKTSIESVLSSIIKTANGQYIALNSGNQQYYLDLKRDIDFETLVSQKAETLGPGKLDEYYYDVLRRTIFEDATVASNPHVRSPQVWQYEVPWKAHGVTRTGYLFFGAPNQRDTASPPRDCYLYFLQPFTPSSFQDARKPDELFFRLAGGDDTFRSALRLYAGAQEMALVSAAGSKSQYEELARGHLRTLSKWLTENHATAFQATYQGNRVAPPVAAATNELRERIADIAATSFAAHFTTLAPDYPVFRSLITATNRAQAATDAIRWFGGAIKSQLGIRVLDGLGLLAGDSLSVDASPYAQAIRQMMDARGEGQVINRSELVEPIGGIDYWTRFRLEPEFLAVVVAAMAYTGNAVVNTGNGVNLDATSGALFTQTTFDNMSNFRHLKRPRDFPVGPLRTLFQLIDVNVGMLANTGARDSAIVALQQRVHDLITNAVRATADLTTLTLWGDQVLSTPDATSLRTRLADAQAFLQSISPLNTVARMTNFPHTSDAINAQKGNLDAIGEVGRLKAFIQHRQPVTQYLQNAELVLGSAHDWTTRMKAARGRLLARLAIMNNRDNAAFHSEFDRETAAFKDEYRTLYLEAHARARLDVQADRRKASLGKDTRLLQLGQLKSISMLPVQQLTDLQNQLASIRTCFSLTPSELNTKSLCPHCEYRPAEEPATNLSAADAVGDCDTRMGEIIKEWTDTLLRNLGDPMVKEGLDLLAVGEGRTAVSNFVESGALPDPVPPSLVTTIGIVLAGLEKVELTPAAIQAALAVGGLPCTVAELKARFERLITDATRGKTPGQVRVVIGSDT